MLYSGNYQIEDKVLRYSSFTDTNEMVKNYQKNIRIFCQQVLRLFLGVERTILKVDQLKRKTFRGCNVTICNDALEIIYFLSYTLLKINNKQFVMAFHQSRNTSRGVSNFIKKVSYNFELTIHIAINKFQDNGIFFIKVRINYIRLIH